MKRTVFTLLTLIFFTSIMGLGRDKKLLFEGKRSYETGNYKNGIKFLTEFLNLHRDFKKTILNYSPRVERAYALRGNCYFRLGDFKRAISDYNLSLKINDAQSVVWHNRGLSLLRIGEFKKGINSFKKALSINKQQEISYYYLGICYEKLSNFPLAVKSFQKLISINDINGNGYLKLAQIYFDRSKDKLAEKMILTSLGLKDKPVSIFKLEDPLLDITIYGFYRKPPLLKQIMEYLRVNNFKKAVKMCKKEIEKNSGNREVLESLGIIYFTEKKDDDAISYLKRAVSLDGSDLLALNYLGLSYLRKGMKEKAKDFFLKAKSIRENLISDVMLTYLERVK